MHGTAPASAQRGRFNAYPRQAEEWYLDPAFCTELLLREEAFGPKVWDPHCGIGTIPEVLRQAGYETKATDLVDRGYEHFDGCLDFLQGRLSVGHPPEHDFAFNPPYGKARMAVASIERALSVTRRYVAALVADTFLYSQRRHPLFTGDWPIARIYHLSKRPSMAPGDVDAAPHGGKQNYAWLVFDLEHIGRPTTWWLCPEEGA